MSVVGQWASFVDGRGRVGPYHLVTGASYIYVSTACGRIFTERRIDHAALRAPRVQTCASCEKSL